ncbi:hypothetical protein RclHR1_13590002 [Rhizophagus clarus]|nr:hypothetical protein RclHR1_13590002 [Rhizophagus clarus]
MSSILWQIDEINLQKSKILKCVKKPKEVKIYNPILRIRFSIAVAKYNGSKCYYIEVDTPFNNSSIQRYGWVKNETYWSFIAINNPDNSMAEFRNTQSNNEFEIKLLEQTCAGWYNRNNGTQLHKNNSIEFNHWTEFVIATTIVFEEGVFSDENRLLHHSCNIN